MKKILLTAAVALSCFGAYALPDVPSVTSTNLTFGLNLDDIIVMPLLTSTNIGTKNFNSSSLYDINSWSLAPYVGSANFTVSSNRMFDVTTSLASISWTQNGHAYNGTYDVNNAMPGDKIGFRCTSFSPAVPGGTGSYSTTVYSSDPSPYPAGFGLNTQNVITNGPWGRGSIFAITLYAMPGWLYTGGLYTGIFTVTATQK